MLKGVTWLVMEYILFAFLAMVASACNTIFNRLSANHVSTGLSAFLKSLFITLACFLICACLGHVPTLYSFSLKQWLFIGLNGLLTSANWIFYFAAIKRSHLEAFSPFEETAALFFGNILFLIPPFFNSVTNGGGWLNIVFYFAGLCFLGGAIVMLIFNKKINPSQKKLWIIYAIISALSLAATMFVVKWQLSDVASDKIAFHQMIIVLVVTLVLVLANREIKHIKELKWQDYLRFFIAALFNAALMVFRYRALNYANSIPSLVNIIISLEFVLVSLATIIFFKAKNKGWMLLLISLVVTGMVFNLLSGVL